MPLQPDPSIALLNIKPLEVSCLQFKFILQITTAAKQMIAKAWESPTLHTLEVKHRITRAMIHTKNEAVVLDRASKYESLWQPWVDHFLPSDFDSSLLLP